MIGNDTKQSQNNWFIEKDMYSQLELDLKVQQENEKNLLIIKHLT
jgi:hypothetical protein